MTLIIMMNMITHSNNSVYVYYEYTCVEYLGLDISTFSPGFLLFGSEVHLGPSLCEGSGFWREGRVGRLGTNILWIFHGIYF